MKSLLPLESGVSYSISVTNVIVVVLYGEYNVLERAGDNDAREYAVPLSWD